MCNASDWISDSTHTVLKSLPYKSIVNKYSNHETSMATWNNTSMEVSLSDKNDTYNYYSVGDVPLDNRIDTKLVVFNKKQNVFIKSHNISSYLKNEICTRAP